MYATFMNIGYFISLWMEYRSSKIT